MGFECSWSHCHAVYHLLIWETHEAKETLHERTYNMGEAFIAVWILAGYGRSPAGRAGLGHRAYPNSFHSPFCPKLHTNKENFMNQRRHTRAADCLCSLPFQKRIISFSARLRTFIRTFFAPAILIPNLLSLDLRSQFLDIAVSLRHPSPWSLPCHCTTVHTMSHHAGNQPLGFPVVMTRNKSSLLGLNISRSPSPRLGLANSCTV